ncbi:hypothetical protein F5146DRAFT_1022600, partial [Armillaria mellea]
TGRRMLNTMQLEIPAHVLYCLVNVLSLCTKYNALALGKNRLRTTVHIDLMTRAPHGDISRTHGQLSFLIDSGLFCVHITTFSVTSISATFEVLATDESLYWQEVYRGRQPIHVLSRDHNTCHPSIASLQGISYQICGSNASTRISLVFSSNSGTGTG